VYAHASSYPSLCIRVARRVNINKALRVTSLLTSHPGLAMDIPSAVLGQGSSVDQAHPLDTSHVRDVDAPAASPTPVSHSLLAQEVAGAQPELAAAVVRGGGGNVRFFAEEMLNSRLVLGAVLVDRVYAHSSPPCFERLPNEILLHVLGFLDVSDLLVTSRVS
jgi:hypothetical protein